MYRDVLKMVSSGCPLKDIVLLLIKITNAIVNGMEETHLKRRHLIASKGLNITNSTTLAGKILTEAYQNMVILHA